MHYMHICQYQFQDSRSVVLSTNVHGDPRALFLRASGSTVLLAVTYLPGRSRPEFAADAEAK